ncbi:hypothetical protein ElyMa_003650400 [Elysia marginata]|uniref:Saposin B-type domain-containing protein n=1 Tax=Elysia marginata TaxID=1093978 RepID=A0AAV4EVZ3_9GAST|nr:hypothetical protein ElyMa_003650400 [Elysia marginata]
MVKCKWNNELDKAAEDIDKLPDHARMFKAVKSLNRKKSENPKMFDADGKFITNIDEIQTVIGFIAVVCLSLLVAVVNCQTEGGTDNSMAATCEQVCDQVCGVCGQILTWTSGYVAAIEPYVETSIEYCLEGCAMGCSFIG